MSAFLSQHHEMRQSTYCSGVEALEADWEPLLLPPGGFLQSSHRGLVGLLQEL